MSLETFFAALTLSAGYNAAIVGVGAGLLGAWAAGIGTFVLLRKRALVSDAVSHATLPGLCVAFLVMVQFGGDGRSLSGLLIGAALSAALGLIAVDWIVARTRLAEDSAIGAVLSVFFGAGVVLLTVIQTQSAGRQAGLDGFLLGSTAGMLLGDAMLIAAAAALGVAGLSLLRRPMLLVAFDAEFAASTGVRVRRIDLAMLGLALAVTVIGIKVVGLVLIVALMIIPPVAARFWTDRANHMALIAALIGGVSGYVGTAISAAGESLPTGPIIVLVTFLAFAASFALAPLNGLIAAMLRFRSFERRVHERQGLLALARGEPVYDRHTRAVLAGRGFLGTDGVATLAGLSAAAAALQDEARWDIYRRLDPSASVVGRYDGLTRLADVLTEDEISDIDRRLALRTK